MPSDPAPEALVVPVPGGGLAADRWPGRPPTVVLLHAGVADRRGWRPVAARLSAAGHRVLAYDRRGFGDSPPSDDGGFTHLSDLEAVLTVAGTERVWLVGSSMGGLLALDAALTLPDRLAGLVLLAPAVSGSPDPEPEALDAATRRLDENLEQAEDPEEVNRLEAWLWLDGPGEAEGRVSGEPRALARAMNAVILANQQDDDAGNAGLDAWGRLEEIRVPPVVAWGELDLPFLVEQSRAVAQRLPDAFGHELPGTAHLPFLEAPEQVAQLVLDALGRR